MLGVLKHLHQALSDQGVLLMSMVRGDREGYSERPTGFRYVTGWEYDSLKPKLESAKFQIIEHYYRLQGSPIEECSWLVMVAQKMG